MALHISFYLLLHLYFLAVARKTEAAGASQLQAMGCSLAGNYTITDQYAANLNQLLATLTNNTVSVNGGFFNGTVGQGDATVYGLAMCFADFSREDCSDCLNAASSSGGGLVKRCPGSVTVTAVFDQCMVRYSNHNFFGAAETDIVFKINGESVASKITYRDNLSQGLAYLSAQAATSPHRFAASAAAPYALVQCTWDLPPDICKDCIDRLSANASNLFEITRYGERKSYSCRVRYSNSSFTVVPPVSPTQKTSQSVDRTGDSSSATGSNSPTAPSTANSNIGAIVGSVGGAAVVVVVVYFVAYRCRIQKRLGYQRQAKITIRPTEVNIARQFTRAELKRATNDFSVKLGSGSFGEVFRGTLEKGGQVAVKRFIKVDDEAKQEYVDEIETIRELKHRNLVILKGWCNEEGELYLVYELMEKGSLSTHLYRPTNPAEQQNWRPLDWEKRHKIITGIASGLCYLHDGSEKGIIHRDIKPANVLLNGSFEAKLADFGLVRLVDHEKSAQTMTVGGTMCYLDPDYMKTRKASKQSDVYSFGVVLLEILTGEKAKFQDQTNTLVLKVRELHANNKIVQATDRALDYVDRNLMKRMLLLGLHCLHPDHRYRPTSTQVLAYIQNDKSLSPNQLPQRSIYRQHSDTYTTASSIPVTPLDTVIEN